MGIVKELAEKFNVKTSDVKSAIMKSATYVYKKMKEELGVSKLPRDAYFLVLKHSVPTAWKIAKEEKKLPTGDEVYRVVVEEWPTWKTELQGFLVKA